jgi:hypothetical protein
MTEDELAILDTFDLGYTTDDDGVHLGRPGSDVNLGFNASIGDAVRAALQISEESK